MIHTVSPLALLIALAQPADTGHRMDPLDPLSASEMAVVREVLGQEGKLTPELRFALMELRELSKDAVFAQRRGGPGGRTAEAILYDWASSTPIRAHVDLRRRKLIRWDTLPSREPPMRVMIRRRLEEVARKDPRWHAALGRRGILDPALVSVIPGLRESMPLPWVDGRRVIYGQSFHREAFPGANAARGVRLRVDLTRGAILEFTDTGTVSPVEATEPETPAPRARPGVPGLTVRGSELRWRNWHLRFGMHPKRGLEIWDVGWIENGRERPILYRASVSEAMSLYGDPDFSIWYPRDAGNDGLGNAQENSSVEPGDAPPGALLVDAVMPDDFGRAVPMPRAVAIYERDGGVLWRHSKRSQRAHQLVLTAHATIDNYDFVFNWIFGEDGAIDVEANLTGLMLVYRDRGSREDTSSGAHSSSSHRVAPGVRAPGHQHFFSYRLDFDIEGAQPNRVLELESRSIRKSRRNNPQGLWFAMHETLLASENAAVREAEPAASRMWKILNPARRNGLGDPVGYALVPGVSALPLPAASSPVRRQAGFLNAQLFVTPFRRDEMYAAGEFQNFGLENEGLARWVRGDRNLVDTDVVLWFTLGVTHVPRPEEYPVMPLSKAGFRLIPSGFFGANPAYQPTRAPTGSEAGTQLLGRTAGGPAPRPLR